MSKEGGRHILKKIVLIDLVLVIYIILTSTIISVRSENKVIDVFIDSFDEWSQRKFGVHQDIIDREKKLTAQTDIKLAERLIGRILLQIESDGEAWYVNPEDKKRYYLGRPRDAWLLAHEFGIKLSEKEIFQYAYFEKKFPKSMAGGFIFNEAEKSQVFYVRPETLEGIEFGSAKEALAIMQQEGLGVDNVNIRKIEVGDLIK